MNIPTRRTLVVPRPLLNNFERYKIDPRSTTTKMKDNPAFHEFLSKNPLPYYVGNLRVVGSNGTPNEHLEGGSFLSEFADGFRRGFSTTLDIGSKILPLIGLGKKKRAAKKKAMNHDESEESEKEEEQHEIEHIKHEEVENKKLNKIVKLAKDMKKNNKKILRGEMVRDLMRKHKGMKLGDASRYIKEHNLI
jgi:hypothetical protein